MFLMTASLQSVAQTSSHPGFIFLPFENKSSFTGKWNVGVDVPRFLNAYIKERYRIPTISPVIIKNYQQEKQLPDRSLVLTLFGKQSERTLEYRDLDKIAFGTKEFNQTVIGQACFQLGEHVSLDLENTLPSIRAWTMTSADSLLLYSQSLDSISLGFKPTTITGAVVFIEGKSAFINLGSEDGVRLKQRLYVYRDVDQTRTRVGELEIVDVRGRHLSLATVISVEGEIMAKDQVIVTIIR